MIRNALAAFLLVVLFGCVDMGNSEINDVLPDWEYIRSDAPGYCARDKKIAGNCVDYSVKAYNIIARSGVELSRIKLVGCMVNGEAHMVCIVDGHKVYSVGEKWVLEKDKLDWEWVGGE